MSMVFRITMKDPDGPFDCVKDEARRFAEMLAEDERLTGRLDPEELDLLQENREALLTKVVKGWLKWGEYVTLEFNIEAGTCRVVRPGAEHEEHVVVGCETHRCGKCDTEWTS